MEGQGLPPFQASQHLSQSPFSLLSAKDPFFWLYYNLFSESVSSADHFYHCSFLNKLLLIA